MDLVFPEPIEISIACPLNRAKLLITKICDLPFTASLLNEKRFRILFVCLFVSEYIILAGFP